MNNHRDLSPQSPQLTFDSKDPAVVDALLATLTTSVTFSEVISDIKSLRWSM